MLTGEVKQRLIEVLSELDARHQRARAQVTEEVMKLFFHLIYPVAQLNFFHVITAVPVVHTYYQVFSMGQNVFLSIQIIQFLAFADG